MKDKLADILKSLESSEEGEKKLNNTRLRLLSHLKEFYKTEGGARTAEVTGLHQSSLSKYVRDDNPRHRLSFNRLRDSVKKISKSKRSNK